MKRLILIRHAEAEIVDITSGDSDKVRNLTKLGHDEAASTGSFVASKLLTGKCKILASPATRTLQTSEIISGALEDHSKEITEILYRGPVGEILEIILQQDEDIQTLIVIGHNPYIYQIALTLAEEVDGNHYSQLLEDVTPTGGAIVIDFNNMASWQQLLTTPNTLNDIFSP